MLDRQLDTLEANGVHEAVVVTGFHDDRIEEDLAKRSGGPNVRTIFNPFYKVADNTGSLYMAREELSGDCLVWNGDTLVSNALMRRVVENRQAGICVTIDRKPSYDDDDMKVVEEGGQLKAIGKRLDPGQSTPNRSACWPSAPVAPNAFAKRSRRRCARPRAPRSGTCA